jgi:hypothetical protein
MSKQDDTKNTAHAAFPDEETADLIEKLPAIEVRDCCVIPGEA